MKSIVCIIGLSSCLFACNPANSHQALGQNVECILRSVHDQDFAAFKQCINTVFNFGSEEDEVWRFHFLTLVSFYKSSGQDIEQIHFQFVPPDKYDSLDDLTNVDVVLYDRQGQVDSSIGALYGALHLGYDTTSSTSGAVLVRLDVKGKYDREYRDHLLKAGKLKEFYPDVPISNPGTR
jgi:hypothetical protein